jgi:hypothetical protein
MYNLVSCKYCYLQAERRGGGGGGRIVPGTAGWDRSGMKNRDVYLHCISVMTTVRIRIIHVYM